MPPTPLPKPTPSVSPPPPANVLPYDSTLLFVLDDPISSQGSKPGEVVRAHLKNAIVVGGRVVAAAGAPATIRIVDASPSEIMDVYGFVDIFFEPLALSDGRSLPLRAPVSRLEPRVSSGHESTVAAEDTAGDIFVPYYPLWQIMRKGKNFVVGAGSVIPAKTEATLTAQSNGSIAIVTPAPPEEGQPAAATFPLSPLATPFGPAGTMPHSRSPHPSPSPSPTALPSPTPT